MAFRAAREARLGVLGLALLGFCALTRDGISAPAGLPHPSAGQINGKIAITVVPTKLGNSGKREVVPPWGFVAHLTDYDNPGKDVTFPSGIWSQPPKGRYRVWVEGEWQISPFTYVVRYSPQPFRGSGQIAAAAVGEAGRVALPAGLVKRPNQTLRLLHAGSHLDGGFPRWELSRRMPASEVGEGLLMPVGPAIGSLWDEESQSYTALSRPFEVKARQTVTVPLEEPAGVAHLVAQLQYSALAGSAAEADIEAVLLQGTRALAPDLKVRLADRAYVVWYGLRPGPGELRAETKSSVLPPRQLNLLQGKIERVFVKMQARPDWAAGTR